MTDWPNHQTAWREWRTAMSGSRMHHGWLLAGKSGLGKLEFAFAAARELVAEEGLDAPLEHPDVISVTYSAKEDKDERAQADGKPFQLSKLIRERDIGRMQRRLQTRPTMGSRRVVIVHPADDMNTHAANKLLKSLEEPPQGTFFMLVTHRPARLLPTIRSRCRILRFPKLTDAQLERMLEEGGVGPEGEARLAAIRAAEGSYGTALRFAEQELGPVAAAIAALLYRGDPDLTMRAELARLIGPRADRARLDAVFELAQATAANMARTTPDPAQAAALADAHQELVTLAAQAPTYNFDTGLLAQEIGGLLMRAAPASSLANG